MDFLKLYFSLVLIRFFQFMFGKKIRFTLKRILDWGYEVVCPHLPLQRKIVFDNFLGRGMGDDPKYIALYIKEHYPDVKLIWLLADMNTLIPDGITPVFIYSRKARYHLYTAKIWVDNIKVLEKTPKRKGQFYLQTWHDCISGLKRSEARIEILLNEEYVKAAKFDASITDLMYSDNDLTKSIFENYHWYHGEVVKCDKPRVSILLNFPIGLRKKVLNYFGIYHEKKIVLYAPTCRSSNDTSIFVWNYEKVVRLLSSKFGGDFVMLLRLHPIFAKMSNNLRYSEKVISASAYPDMQELLAVSDVLISDYSGCMLEYAITRKPVFAYGADLEKYINDERGLIFELEELPFKISTSETNLYQSILEYNETDYFAKLSSFYKKIGFEDTGNGCQQVSELLLEHIS